MESNMLNMVILQMIGKKIKISFPFIPLIFLILSCTNAPNHSNISSVCREDEVLIVALGKTGIIDMQDGTIQNKFQNEELINFPFDNYTLVISNYNSNYSKSSLTLKPYEALLLKRK